MDATLSAQVQDMVVKHDLSSIGWEEEADNSLCDDKELIDFIQRNNYALHTCLEAFHLHTCHEFSPSSPMDTSNVSYNLQGILGKYAKFSSLDEPRGRKMKILYYDNFSMINLYQFLGYVNKFDMTDKFELHIASYDKSLLEDIAKQIKSCVPLTTKMITLLFHINPREGLVRSLRQYYATKLEQGAIDKLMKYDFIELDKNTALSEKNERDEAELFQVRATCILKK